MIDISRGRKGLRFLVALLLVGAAPAESDSTLFENVRQADLRVGTIGWRLAAANAPLCDRTESGTGLVLHTLDQFDSAKRDAARQHFHFDTPVAVEAVVNGSPAERAGLRPDDSLVRVGSVEISALKGKAGTTDRLVAAQLAIGALPAGAPVMVDAMRGGVPIRVALQMVPVCKMRFELELNGGYTASADGAMVQIGSGFLDDYSDSQFAAAIAHEMAHNVLHHRDRLDARGVNFGMLSGFGGNVKYFRQTEIQADLLSVYLLANADYPATAAVDFWQKFGPSKAGGILRSRSHPAWRDRVSTLQAEAAKVAKELARPIVPAMLADRDKPLDGDWQSLLVRHR